MNITEAIRQRRSIRSFRNDPVPRKILDELLDTCRWAPSSSNTQAWELAVMGGGILDMFRERLVRKLLEEWDNENLLIREHNPDIPYPAWPEPYLSRAVETRNKIDRHQFPPGTPGLEEKRYSYLIYGGRLYDAPNAILLSTEKSVCPKAITDIGIMAQTIALAALEYGLGTCIMAMPVGWPEIIRELLEMPESKLIALVIAIGYPETEAKVNRVERNREPLEKITTWHGI